MCNVSLTTHVHERGMLAILTFFFPLACFQKDFQTFSRIFLSLNTHFRSLRDFWGLSLRCIFIPKSTEQTRLYCNYAEQTLPSFMKQEQNCVITRQDKSQFFPA